MKRRSLLQSLAALPAAGLMRAQQPVVPPKPSPAATEDSIPVVESTIPDIAGTTLPAFFTREQFAALRHLSDVIYPPMNGVPGALAAYAPEFLDFLIGESPADRQNLYSDGLDYLDRKSKERFGVPFPQTSQSQADALLTPLCREWTATAKDDLTAFLRAAKQDIIAATENSHGWIRIMSKRVRSAGGLGMYWYPIE